MSATEKFRVQHSELEEIVGRIIPLLDPAQLATELPRLRALLSTLLGKLSMHLAMEDNALYPQLLKHSDAAVRAMAKEFAGEMSTIKPKVDAFARKWNDSQIRADMPGFGADARIVFAALADRIRRENREFYALVDRSAGA